MADPRRRTLDDFPPEQRAAIEAIRARNRTPEARAEDARVRQLARVDFPPTAADEEALAALAALRRERERLRLSLADVADRSGIDLATLPELETGRQPNPTLDTLRRYAGALGKRLTWTIQDALGPSR